MDRVADLGEAVDAQFTGSQDFKIGVAKQATEEGLHHLYIVDLFQRGIDHTFIENTLEVDYSPVGDDILVIPPVQIIAQQAHQRDDQNEIEQSHQRDGGDHGEDQGNKDEDCQTGNEFSDDFLEKHHPVLAGGHDDFLALAE